MSGGVDSSVAAALLLQQGYPVIGVMLRLWSENGQEANNRCCTPDAVVNARRVAGLLDIPFYVLDARDYFREKIVQFFLNGYAVGITPNPCIECNRIIRWGFLLDHAQNFGAEMMATGHYARLRTGPTGVVDLLCGLDESKDQAYVLSRLTQAQLRRTLLPLGELTKLQVRELAREFKLPVAERPDSQDLCFLAGEDYRSFLIRQAPQVNMPGSIMNRQGQILGEHRGLAFYTIGQRKGLGLSSSDPLYVLEKKMISNALIVGTENELGQKVMLVKDLNWISGLNPLLPFRVNIKIRYKADKTPGILEQLEDNHIQVVFENSRRDITPGQLAVFYNDDIVVGSGIIC